MKSALAGWKWGQKWLWIGYMGDNSDRVNTNNEYEEKLI